MLKTLLFLLIGVSVQARVNLEREVKGFVRPFGYVYQEVKRPVKNIFVTPAKFMHMVRAETFYQTEVASGHVGTYEMAAALPDPSALGRKIQVYFPGTGRSMLVIVKEIGPNAVRDAYWNEERGPEVEDLPRTAAGQKIQFRSGIALTPAVWRRLGVTRDWSVERGYSAVVGWRFLHDVDLDRQKEAAHGDLPPRSPFTWTEENMVPYRRNSSY